VLHLGSFLLLLDEIAAAAIRFYVVNVHVLARLDVFRGRADAISVLDHLRPLGDGTDGELVTEWDSILQLESLAFPVDLGLNAPPLGSILGYQRCDIIFGIDHENFFAQIASLSEKSKIM
jgi:hypothetical protein